MDRSFKNNADFKMNQQNFRLSDFGIESRSNHDSKSFVPNGQCKTVRNGSQPCSRYGQVPQLQHRLTDVSNAAAHPQVASNRCRPISANPAATLTCNNQVRSSSNQSQAVGQLQNVGADRFQASSPSNLSGTGPMLQPTVSAAASPGYWKQYGGQESGVNTRIPYFPDSNTRFFRRFEIFTSDRLSRTTGGRNMTCQDKGVMELRAGDPFAGLSTKSWLSNVSNNDLEF
ncbi:hypothetical protein KM043_011616 [Ampulex compressa]|nr:hypothetical protein KM043_011616 [Ampulex compressa]